MTVRGLFAGGIAAAAVLTLSACAQAPHPGSVKIALDPYASTYVRYPGAPTLIRGATVYDGDGGRIERGAVLLRDGAFAYSPVAPGTIVGLIGPSGCGRWWPSAHRIAPTP